MSNVIHLTFPQSSSTRNGTIAGCTPNPKYLIKYFYPLIKYYHLPFCSDLSLKINTKGNMDNIDSISSDNSAKTFYFTDEVQSAIEQVVF